MVVIARFPRLDSTAAVEPPAASVVVAKTSSPNGAAGVAVPGRVRTPRSRFPAVSTIVLAVLAGVFWGAVWREEQRRAAEDADRDREAMAMEPDLEAGVSR